MSTSREQSRHPGTALVAAFRQLLLVAVLFLAYKAGRIATAGHTGRAAENADAVWRLERLLHLPHEAALQRALIPDHVLIISANSYYAYVHFPATAAVLVWLYRRHRAHYRQTRDVLVWLTAAAFVVHVLFPLTPPRLAGATGLLDTGALYGPGVYGDPETDALSNQFAAMPSLHVGWAVVVAVAVFSVTRGRWRGLWLLHPVATLLVVVVTGNHYWLDAVSAVALLVLIGYAVRQPAPAGARLRTRQWRPAHAVRLCTSSHP